MSAGMGEPPRLLGVDIGGTKIAIAVVEADNDVNAAALGEARYGAGRGLDSFLFVAVGTGLGGAIVVGGRVMRGATGTAGEIGHVPVFGAEDVVCSCGRSGHLEAVVAAPAISAAYERATG